MFITEYTVGEGCYFCCDEHSKFFMFHGSPDLTIKRKCCENDDRVVVVHKGNTDKDKGSTDDSDDTAGDTAGETDTEESTYSDIAIVENKHKTSDTVMINRVVLPREVGEVLANLHSLLVKKTLNKLTKGNAFDVDDDKMVTKGIFVSKELGVCHCLLMIPIVTIGDGTVRNTSQKVDVTSYMYGHLDCRSLCYH